jgi:hypothetical protein
MSYTVRLSRLPVAHVYHTLVDNRELVLNHISAGEHILLGCLEALVDQNVGFIHFDVRPLQELGVRFPASRGLQC